MNRALWPRVALLLTPSLLHCGVDPSPGEEVPRLDGSVDESRPTPARTDPAGDGRVGENCGNGLDDDNDGAVDNGCPCSPGASQRCFVGRWQLAGVGQCTVGLQTCSADGEFAGWGPCTGYGTPAAELCDGIDNDCDPTTGDDSADVNVGQACDGPDDDLCSSGRVVCEDGHAVCVEGPRSSVELCDGIDNDCDASTLDGAAEPTLGWSCDGPDDDACLEGSIQCVASHLTCDDWTPSNAESCDRLDNDCDTRIDEDLPPVEDVFVYGEATVARPVDIVWVVDQSSSMREEISNVRANLNGYSSHLDASGMDYFLQLIAARVGSLGLCLDPPLGGAGCTDGPRFHQLPLQVSSNNALRLIEDSIGELEAHMRTGSRRVFVVVTDDDSEIPATAFDGWLRARSGYDDYSFNAVIGRRTCPGTASRGLVYEQLALITGGRIEDICTSDWAASFSRFAADLVVRTLVYPLSQSPCSAEVRVFFGGSEQMEGSAWSYDPVGNTIVLDAAFAPARGTLIHVRYVQG